MRPPWIQTGFSHAARPKRTVMPAVLGRCDGRSGQVEMVDRYIQMWKASWSISTASQPPIHTNPSDGFMDFMDYMNHGSVLFPHWRRSLPSEAGRLVELEIPQICTAYSPVKRVVNTSIQLNISILLHIAIKFVHLSDQVARTWDSPQAAQGVKQRDVGPRQITGPPGCLNHGAFPEAVWIRADATRRQRRQWSRHVVLRTHHWLRDGECAAVPGTLRQGRSKMQRLEDVSSGWLVLCCWNPLKLHCAQGKLQHVAADLSHFAWHF